MKRIIRSRGYGKTWDLIDYADKNNAVIVCPNIAWAKGIEIIAREELGIEVETCSITDMERLRGQNKKFVVEEIEGCMQTILRGNMIGWNMSME